MLISIVGIEGLQARTNLGCFRGSQIVEDTQCVKPGFTCFRQPIHDPAWSWTPDGTASGRLSSNLVFMRLRTSPATHPRPW